MDANKTQLQITVAHALPGRIRLHASHPPHCAAKTERMMKSHMGVQSAVYTPRTQSLLVFYDPEQIALEEIILRASLSLSVDYSLQSVVIETIGSKTPLSFLAVFSGLSLIAAHLTALFTPHAGTLRAIQAISGLWTGAAIGEHIYLDLKDKGKFHPEVLSIVYLLLAFLRGRALKGASIAWVMTFARHLMEPPAKVLKLKTKTTDPACDAQQCEYKATISRELTAKGYAGLITRLPQMLLGMYTDMQLTAEDHIFKEIQKVSRKHNDVLEGLEDLDRGIRLQVRP